VRDGADIPTMAVGLITRPSEAEAIVAGGRADMIALAREALDDPNWAVHAEHDLGAKDPYASWPKQAAGRVRDKDKVLHLREYAN
jgi:2,4-dienoyl-CoA reductase-like NADH-dependent reductase (Old Yellow Enzyme family)